MRRVGVLDAGRLLGAGDPVADTREALELEGEVAVEPASPGPAPLSRFPGGLTLRQNGSRPDSGDRLQAVMVQKVRDLLSAAEPDQLSNDIMEELPPGRQEGSKDPQDIFRELVAGRARPALTLEPVTDPTMEYVLQGDYGGEEGEGDYYDYQDEYNLVESEEKEEEEEELVDEDDRVAAINYEDVLEGNSEELFGNLDYTDNLQPLRPLPAHRPLRRPVTFFKHMLFGLGLNPFIKEGQATEGEGASTTTKRPKPMAFPELMKDITIFKDPKEDRRGLQSSLEAGEVDPGETLKTLKRSKKKARAELANEVTTEEPVKEETTKEATNEETTNGGHTNKGHTNEDILAFDYLDYGDNSLTSSVFNVDSVEMSNETLEYEEGSGDDWEDASEQFVPESEIAGLDHRFVVDTDSGRVFGQEVLTATGLPVAEYHGVPYAEAPVGPRRFLSPLPPRPWGGVRRAVTPGPRCWDGAAPNSWEAGAGAHMAEDCLYLSVWSPRGEARPVLVWLTAGGEMEDGAGELAARGEVLVVRVESRRGALGFLALGGEEVPGNAGLMDQVQALRWVRANIDRFGGDPARVTLMGVGQGADHVSLHLLSPLACPLFHAAILMSGATPPPLPSSAEASGQAGSLGRLLACPGAGPGLLACLRAVDPQVLTNQERAAAPLGFLPTVDGAFVVEQPGDLMEGSFFKKAPLLLGSNTAEGQDTLLQLVPDMEAREVLVLTPDELDSALARVFPSHPDSIQSLIKFQYGMFGDEGANRTESAVRRFWGLESVLADLRTVCPVGRLGRRVAADGSPVYRYHYTGEWQETSLAIGAPLAALGRGGAGPEQEASLRILQHWANFVKHHDPNGLGGEEEGMVAWPPYSAPSWRHLVIGRREEEGEALRGRVCQFWDEILPQFLPPTLQMSPREGRVADLTCREVLSTARLYFPGYRPLRRLGRTLV